MQQLQPLVSSIDHVYPINLRSAGVTVVDPDQFSPRCNPASPDAACRSGYHQDEKQRRLEELLQKVSEGSHKAFQAVYELTLSRITNVVNAIIFNPSDRDEVIGDVYLQLWKLSGDYRSGRGSVTGWITVIARSRALDFKRKQTRLAKNELLHFQQEVTPCLQENEPQDLHELVQCSAVIERLVQQLPSVHRRLISLVYFSGLSHREISLLTGLPLGTVKSHVRRSLLRLRDQLEKESRNCEIVGCTDHSIRSKSYSSTTNSLS